VANSIRDLPAALLFELRPDALQQRKPQSPALNALLTALLSTRNLIAPIIAHAAFGAFYFAGALLWRIHNRALVTRSAPCGRLQNVPRRSASIPNPFGPSA
jgi:hypothetical protein